MASHVVGPLLIADRPLSADEVTLLDTETVWTIDLLFTPDATSGYISGALVTVPPLTARLMAAPMLSARLETTNGE